MNNISVKMILTLTFISMLAGALLSGWDMITQPLIEKHRQEAIRQAIKEVLPPFFSYREIQLSDRILYEAIDSSKNIIGYAVKTSGNGFQGKIVIMTGLSANFETLSSISILEQLETPGLGTKIVSDPSHKKDIFWFPAQFKGLQYKPEIKVLKNAKIKNNNEIMAITGATISA
ncbi:MAG: FMN-binding protein, partial [Candidatus Marinimicrobia bacterium]|nr:FMN-binding protein [Candidatus Neomarinimicrobiota bacterium]